MAKTRRVRITVREDVVDRAELAAEVLGVPSPTTLLGVAAGVGLRFLEMAVVRPVAASDDVREAVARVGTAAVFEEVGDA